jgi:hypothetical protein
MSQKSRNSDRMHAALCAAFGIVVAIVGSVGAARAADDADNSNGNWVRNLYRKFNERAGAPVTGADSGERPPLVVPPTRDLPPPGTPSALTQRSASWPVDHDEARRKAGATVKAERRPAHWEVENQPSQGSPVATAGVEEQAKPEPSFSTLFWNKFLGRRDPEVGTFTREPPRVSLVDPPRGYRTPSSDQPYGLNNPDTAYTLQKAPLRTGKPEDEGR